jgi:hypothetical protein
VIPTPTATFRHRLDSKIVKVCLKHGRALLSERRLAIVLFFPDSDTIISKPGAS